VPDTEYSSTGVMHEYQDFHLVQCTMQLVCNSNHRISHGLMVSWSHGLMVSWSHGLMVSWSHGLMVSWLMAIGRNIMH
jgi:hypothetical protein